MCGMGKYVYILVLTVHVIAFEEWIENLFILKLEAVDDIECKYIHIQIPPSGV